MGGEGNGFYLKFKRNKVSRFSTRKKKSSFLPHTDYHNSLRLCVCIQSSASAQGYLCSIIDAHHREGGSGMKLFFFLLIWLPSPMNFSCPSKLSLPLHLWLATQTITSTTASEGKRRQQHYPRQCSSEENALKPPHTYLLQRIESVLCVYQSHQVNTYFLAPPFVE